MIRRIYVNEIPVSTVVEPTKTIHITLIHVYWSYTKTNMNSHSKAHVCVAWNSHPEGEISTRKPCRKRKTYPSIVLSLTCSSPRQQRLEAVNPQYPCSRFAQRTGFWHANFPGRSATPYIDCFQEGHTVQPPSHMRRPTETRRLTVVCWSLSSENLGENRKLRLILSGQRSIKPIRFNAGNLLCLD